MMKEHHPGRTLDTHHFIRAHRNLIHPGVQSRTDIEIHKEEALIALNAVKSIARVISERHK